MKKLNLKLSTICICIIFLCSCNNDSEIITQLKKENKELRAKIKLLKDRIPRESDFTYKAIVIPIKRKIKLGEEYKAAVYLGVEKNNNPFKVVLCDLVNDEPIPTKDTLNRSKEWDCALYIKKPVKEGNYVWSGKILREDVDGYMRSYFFKCEYEVTK